GAGAGLIGRASDAVIENEAIGANVRLSSTRRGSALVGALNGLIGDRLELLESDLDQGTSVRLGGEPVTLEQAALRAAFPEASERIVVLVHGLMGTEFYWDWGAREAGENYGARLAADLGCTPVYVRYNSGRHISENGRSLAAMLEELVDAWPAQVREIAL